MSEVNWTPEFQRLVLAAAVGGDLLDSLPLDPELFATSRDRGPSPPRQRIAAAVAAYFAEYRARPSGEVFDQVMADTGRDLPPEERAELERESAAVRLTEVPEDQAYLRDRVREQAQLRAFERGVIQAAQVAAAGPASLPRAFEIMARAMEPVGATESRRVEYIAGSPARLEAWRRGDQMGERIPTGFPALDEVLRGGPTRKEVHYFLAPPKGGKTAALLTVAGAALRRRYGVYIVTFEMQAARMALRMDRLMSRSRAEELADDLSRLERAIAGLRASGASELYIDEMAPQTPNAVAEVRRRIARIRRAGGRVDLGVMDYLNIMGSGGEDEKRHELAKVSRDMSTMAKEEDVLVWSAALVNRAAVNKAVIRKTDIAEAFEVIAVLDGATAICATKSMARAGLRRFYEAAAREEADEVRAGDYRVDFPRMLFEPAEEGAVESLPDTGE